MGLSKSKKVKIIGMPIDLGSRPLGVEMGPSAIRYAGLADALARNGMVYEDHGDIRINRVSDKDKRLLEIIRSSEELAELVDQTLGEGTMPIILGGDHSASIGSIAGTAKNRKIGLLWLDCHPDANTPESSPSGNVHGMTVAISLGYGHPRLVNCAGYRPKLNPSDVCIVGAKDIDEEEREFLRKVGVKMFTLSDIERYGMVNIIHEACSLVSKNTDGVHVSFDVDVLDPLIAPGTGILSRGGLSYREIKYLMEFLGKMDSLCAIDVIEVNPLLDVRNQTAELSVELILAALGGSYGDYERNYLRQAPQER